MPFIAGGYGDFPRCDLGGRRRFMVHGTDSENKHSLLVRRSCTSARGNYRTLGRQRQYLLSNRYEQRKRINSKNLSLSSGRYLPTCRPPKLPTMQKGGAEKIDIQEGTS